MPYFASNQERRQLSSLLVHVPLPFAHGSSPLDVGPSPVNSLKRSRPLISSFTIRMVAAAVMVLRQLPSFLPRQRPRRRAATLRPDPAPLSRCLEIRRHLRCRSAARSPVTRGSPIAPAPPWRVCWAAARHAGVFFRRCVEMPEFVKPHQVPGVEQLAAHRGRWRGTRREPPAVELHGAAERGAAHMRVTPRAARVCRPPRG